MSSCKSSMIFIAFLLTMVVSTEEIFGTWMKQAFQNGSFLLNSLEDTEGNSSYYSHSFDERLLKNMFFFDFYRQNDSKISMEIDLLNTPSMIDVKIPSKFDNTRVEYAIHSLNTSQLQYQREIFSLNLLQDSTLILQNSNGKIVVHFDKASHRRYAIRTSLNEFFASFPLIFYFMFAFYILDTRQKYTNKEAHKRRFGIAVVYTDSLVVQMIMMSLSSHHFFAGIVIIFSQTVFAVDRLFQKSKLYTYLTVKTAILVFFYFDVLKMRTLPYLILMFHALDFLNLLKNNNKELKNRKKDLHDSILVGLFFNVWIIFFIWLFEDAFYDLNATYMFYVYSYLTNLAISLLNYFGGIVLSTRRQLRCLSRLTSKLLRRPSRDSEKEICYGCYRDLTLTENSIILLSEEEIQEQVIAGRCNHQFHAKCFQNQLKVFGFCPVDQKKLK